jgi:hypothetical protein
LPSRTFRFSRSERLVELVVVVLGLAEAVYDVAEVKQEGRPVGDLGGGELARVVHLEGGLISSRVRVGEQPAFGPSGVRAVKVVPSFSST